MSMKKIGSVKATASQILSDVQSIVTDDTSTLSDVLSPKQQKINKALDAGGVTLQKKISVLAAGLNAKKSRVEIDEMGRQKVVEDDDLVVQHKFLETGLRVRDVLKDNNINVGVGVSLKVSDEERELLEAYKRG